ncbi:hypothetical protein BB560_004587 [Smittium megazygosporum]|uniref:G protein alpha subunit n=1 Tax=Smittium megazygosporum TaxID=133381 RepID=A0A2T9Z8T4_9FUNG|nr:hypothetical protein BB560_004587 [Smittium megazygosporum]
MGICGSKGLDEYALASEKINKELKADKERLRNEIKILLLGSGESGKSTIVKQMKIMYQNGFTDFERIAFIPIIHRNILESAQEISYGYKICDMAPELPENIEFVENLSKVDVDSVMQVELSDYIINGMSNLWKDPTIPKILQNTYKFYLMDSAPYPSYKPTDDDILRSRSKTTGIIETRFPMGNKTIHMFDVGGQRSERKKWIHCFEEVTSILFCVAISEYDQQMVLKKLYYTFPKQIDVFKEKIKKSPLESFYPEYTGGSDVSLAAKFILWKFQNCNNLGLPLYPHITQATDTSNIRLVFMSVKETLLQNALKDSGIL